MGSILKASGGSPETAAYIMGHQSTESINVYGDRRSGEGSQQQVRPAEGIDLSMVRKPQKPSKYGRGRVVGRIEFPAATRGEWLAASTKGSKRPDM